MAPLTDGQRAILHGVLTTLSEVYQAIGSVAEDTGGESARWAALTTARIHLGDAEQAVYRVLQGLERR